MSPLSRTRASSASRAMFRTVETRRLGSLTSRITSWEFGRLVLRSLNDHRGRLSHGHGHLQPGSLGESSSACSNVQHK